MDPKLVKRIDNMYRNMQPIVVMTFVGVLLPIILLFLAPLGLLYAWQRIKLLDRIANEPAPDDTAVAHQIAYIQLHHLRLFVPAVVLAAGAVLLVILVAIAIANAP